MDAGARISRHYTVFALWERSVFRPGSLDAAAFGGQKVGLSDLFGAAFRYSSNPDRIGLLVEIALGYRWFGARWEDGTKLTASGSFPDVRLGIGADIRLSRHFSLSPLLTLGSGVFNNLVWVRGGRELEARNILDENAQYGTFNISVGGHFDVY